jgi:site-specific recombinase XerD
MNDLHQDAAKVLNVNALHLQRRHGRHCDAGYPLDTLTAESDERRRGAKRCTCPIFASGTLNGVFRKIGTRQRDWGQARAVVEPYCQAGSWTLELSPAVVVSGAPLSQPVAAAPSLLSLEDAIERFLREHRANQTAGATIKKYKEVLKGATGLLRFSRAHGIRFVQEWEQNPVRMLARELCQSWDVAITTRTTKHGVLKSFFEVFVEDGIIERNPFRFKMRRNRAARVGEKESEPRLPYSDEEIRRMLDGCTRYGRTELREWPRKKDGRQVVAISPYRDYSRRWGGEDLADFIEISCHTGLRISDVATFHISRLTDQGEVKLRPQKNGNWICVYIPEYLQKVIRERARKFGPYIFGDRTGSTMHSITTTWRKRLEKLWAQEGPWQHKAMHHRFRHTFVRILLQRQTPITLVARLAGDTEAMILKHYANWVPELQQTSRVVLQEAFRTMPRFRRA